METLELLIALSEELFAINGHHSLRLGVSELEREDSHFKEFSLGLLPVILTSFPRTAILRLLIVSASRGGR